MANNTISQVEINGTTYDLLDANTLEAVSTLEQKVTDLEDSVVPTVLFKATSQSEWKATDVPLTQPINIFDIVEIYFRSSDNLFDSVKYYVKGGIVGGLILQEFHPSGNTIYGKLSQIGFSDNDKKIIIVGNPSRNIEWYMGAGDTYLTINYKNSPSYSIFVGLVLGWKNII